MLVRIPFRHTDIHAWYEAGSNRRAPAFQTGALPSELSNLTPHMRSPYRIRTGDFLNENQAS